MHADGSTVLLPQVLATHASGGFVADVLPLGPAPAGAFLAPRSAASGSTAMTGGMLLVRSPHHPVKDLVGTLRECSNGKCSA